MEADFAPLTNGRFHRATWRTAGIVPYIGAYERYFSQAPVDLFHAHFAGGGVDVLPLARRLQVPLVCTFHGYDVTVLPHEKRLLRRSLMSQLPALFSYASRLIAVSQSIASTLIGLGAPEEKVAVCYNGTHMQPLKYADDADRSGVTFVGRLVQKKGVPDLLEAYATLTPEVRRNNPLRIIGAGPLEKSLKSLASRLDIDPLFLGHLTTTEVLSHLAASSVICVPSRTASNGDSEGLPTVIGEAASLAVPCLAYRHGGIPEAVVDGVSGILVAEGDVRGLSAGLDLILAREVSQRMGEAAHAVYTEKFDRRVNVRFLETMYDEAANYG